jgi:RNA polymerase sigma-70 factor (ECF subfamily)
MDDEDFLARCRRGEGEAWRMLFDRYIRSVYRWAACLGLDAAAAEDASQEVFATAFRRIGDCRAADRLPAWLFQITRRKAANHRRLTWVRRIFRDSAIESGEDGAGIERSAGSEDRDLALDLRRTLGRLPLRDAEVLLLHDLEGRTRAEVAAMLDLAEGTIASRLARARAGFARLWSEEEP